MQLLSPIQTHSVFKLRKEFNSMFARKTAIKECEMKLR